MSKMKRGREGKRKGPLALAGTALPKEMLLLPNKTPTQSLPVQCQEGLGKIGILIIMGEWPTNWDHVTLFQLSGVQQRWWC